MNDFGEYDSPLVEDSFFLGLLHKFYIPVGAPVPSFLGPTITTSIATFISLYKEDKIFHGRMHPYKPQQLCCQVLSSHPHVRPDGEYSPAQHHIIIGFELRTFSGKFLHFPQQLFNYVKLKNLDYQGLRFWQGFPFDLFGGLQLLDRTNLIHLWTPLYSPSDGALANPDMLIDPHEDQVVPNNVPNNEEDDVEAQIDEALAQMVFLDLQEWEVDLDMDVDTD
ncbi:hypothetical protein Fmac_006896 [Flemingia macrophylla]|uniref:Uncharacterized protein n=1 Tax=Flemingia macrophylla TaxID=520843 RepID=A0ABD1NBW8_9FABA